MHAVVVIEVELLARRSVGGSRRAAGYRCGRWGGVRGEYDMVTGSCNGKSHYGRHDHLSDIPEKCSHHIVKRYSDFDNPVTVTGRAPTAGTFAYRRIPSTPTELKAWKPTGFISAKLVAYPALLNL